MLILLNTNIIIKIIIIIKSKYIIIIMSNELSLKYFMQDFKKLNKLYL